MEGDRHNGLNFTMQNRLHNNTTLPQILAANSSKYGDKQTAVRDKAFGIWQKYTWADYYRYMEKTAAG
ncbi:MAG: hypothetical protein ABRQ34_10310, partial [Smithellaceae bacterium]